MSKKDLQALQDDVIHALKNIGGSTISNGYELDELDEELVKDAIEIAVNLIESSKYKRAGSEFVVISDER